MTKSVGKIDLILKKKIKPYFLFIVGMEEIVSEVRKAMAHILKWAHKRGSRYRMYYWTNLLGCCSYDTSTFIVIFNSRLEFGGKTKMRDNTRLDLHFGSLIQNFSLQPISLFQLYLL